jgi:hypothetical protein
MTLQTRTVILNRLLLGFLQFKTGWGDFVRRVSNHRAGKKVVKKNKKKKDMFP